MGIVLDHANDTSLLQLEGVIDIAAAEDLKAALFEAIKAAKAIHISAEAVSELDVCAYQLLWAAEREARRSGCEFAFTGRLPEAVERALASAGLEPIATRGESPEMATMSERSKGRK